jgi:para-nitrobenzyl esterase
MQVAGPLETGRGMPDSMDEDCLNLNVWTPGIDDGRRPVMVWIHGGALVNGAGSLAWYDGSALARSGDLVVVTINYRLNAFGYLHLGDLAPGELDESGNAGLLDQIAALRWVRDNIGAFGGDPERVCVVGESAGSWSVGTLLAVPSAHGLFRSAIMQSGVPAVQSPASATRNAVEVMATLGLGQHEVARLREVPASALLEAADRVTAAQMARAVLEPDPEASPGFRPVAGEAGVGGDALIDLAQTGNGVPVLIGTTLDEMRIMRALMPEMPLIDEAELARRCDRTFGDASAEVRSAYEMDFPDASADDRWVSIQSDLTFGVPTLDFIDRRHGAEAPTWHYRFDWRSPADGGRFGAAHTLEIPFIFDTFGAAGAAEFTGGPPETAHQLAGLVRGAWTSFVRNGSPTADGLPGWPATTAEQPATMIFDDTCRLDHAPMRSTSATRAALHAAFAP